MRGRAPFGDAYDADIERAVQALAAATGAHAGVFTETAFDDAADGLVKDLSGVVAPTLFEEFCRVPGRAWLDRTSHVAHDRFIDDLRTGGWDALLERQPLLPELIRRVVERWSRRYAEGIRHVHEDRDVLATAFSVDAPLVEATQLAETTVRLGDARGHRVVYKNRRVTLDVAWAELLRWFNDRGPAHDLMVPTVVDRRDHGYTDVVVPEPTADHQLEARWHRSGALMCLVHLLGGGDAHEGNVMVCGEHVVLIDAEKIMRPGIGGADVDDASVVMTGWLPSQPTYLRCGLVAELFQPRPQRWFNVGTDAVRQRPSGAIMATIRPRIAELFLTHGDRMIAALSDGFRDAARIVRHHGLPLDLFEHTRPRLIVRNSQEYIDAIDAIVQPSVLREPEQLDAVIDRVVGRPPVSVREVPAIWPAVAAAERDALRSLVIPRFSVWATGDELVVDDRAIGTAFVETPIDRAARFVRDLSADAVEGQVAMIRWSIEGARRGDFAGGVPRGFVRAGDLGASI